MRGVAFFGVTLGGALVGCVALIGADELTTVGPSDAGDASDSTVSPDVPVVSTDGGSDAAVDAGPSCAAPSTCVTAPDGFDGPFIVSFGGTTTCPPSLSRSWERIGASAGASAPPATCTCNCGAFAGACAVTMLEYLGDGCGGNGTPKALALDVCYPTKDEADDFRPMGTPSGSCPPSATTNVVPLEAGTLALGCSPSEPAGCAQGICVPPPPKNTRLCVRPLKEEGDNTSCPNGFTAKVGVSAGVEDSRGCSACTCQTSSLACSYNAKLYDSDDCTGIGLTATGPSCHSQNGIDSMKLLSASATGSCAPNGGAPIGNVTTKSSSLLCCQEL